MIGVPAKSLHDLLADWEADHQGQRDGTRVTPSDAGALCRRQVAFRLNAVPQTDQPDPVTVATVGSLLHIGIARIWEEYDQRHVMGTEVELGEGGTMDTLRAVTSAREFRDTKTVSRSKFDAWEDADGPGEGVWQQLAAYGGRYLRGAGLDPDEVHATMAVDALCRETGRCATYTREWTKEAADAAEGTLRSVAALRGTDPLDVPASRTGHGDWLCDACPWLTACMGPDQRPRVAALDEAQAVDAASEYVHWTRVARDAEAKAKAAKEVLRGAEGTIPGFVVQWTEVPPSEVAAFTRRGYTKLSVRRVRQ